ncbi:hypothetical protein OIU85_009301 [Salix viminalis]|uniref:Uncharacterized protein n=1 Tax=Salix viminalis TaxID=40686 RepID=A0A9Q0NZJ0_SALVM|nr:hypothetical protein OIU85_009301 [Salix viminalis]
MTIRAQSAAKSTMDSVDLYNIENCEARSMSFSCFEQNLWLCISCMCVYTFMSHGFPVARSVEYGHGAAIKQDIVRKDGRKGAKNKLSAKCGAKLNYAGHDAKDGWMDIKPNTASRKSSKQVFLILLEANHGPFWCGYPHLGPFDLSID